MKTFKLHLIRHGLTLGNINGIYVGGGTDLPVCEEGFRQLGILKTSFCYPDAPLLFCSPMLRARQTAEFLFADIKERIVVEDLRENRFGEFEGKPAAQLMQDPNFAQWLSPNGQFVPKGGESGKNFAERVDSALMQMLMHMVKNSVFSAICVAHGGVFMAMLAQRALPQKPPTAWLADAGCGYTIQTSTAMLMRDGIVEACEIIPKGF